MTQRIPVSVFFSSHAGPVCLFTGHVQVYNTAEAVCKKYLLNVSLFNNDDDDNVKPVGLWFLSRGLTKIVTNNNINK